MVKIKILALVLCLGIVGRANAESTDDLLSDCENESIAAQALCQAYLGGVFEATMTLAVAGYMEKTLCIPENGISGKQVRKIFVKYANENPEVLHLDGAYMALSASMAAFPCK